MVVSNLAGLKAFARGERGALRSFDLEAGLSASGFRFSSREFLVSSCFLSFLGWNRFSIEKELRREEGAEFGDGLLSMWLALSLRCRALTTSLTVLWVVRGAVEP